MHIIVYVQMYRHKSHVFALNEGLDAPQYMNRAYIERRNYLVSKLKELGFELDAQPEGAFIYSQVFVTILLMISISASKCLKKHT